MQDDTPEQPKHPGGRPLKFQTVAELERAINRYFKSCQEHWELKSDWVIKGNEKGKPVYDENGQPVWIKAKVRRRVPAAIPDITGLAVALGVTRQTVLNYQERPEFLDTIERAKSICEAANAAQFFGPAARGAIFNAVNNFAGYEDKKVSDVQSKGQPIKAIVEFVGEDDDDGTASQD